MSRIFPHKIHQFVLSVLGSIVLSMPLFIIQENYSLIREDIFTHLFFVSALGICLLFFYFFNKYKSNTLTISFIPKKTEYPLLMWSALFVVLIEICFSTINGWGKESELKAQPLDIYLMLGSIFLAPLMEELLFRQYFLSGLLSANKPLSAIMINAVLFGLIHIKISQIILGVILGLLFACVFSQNKACRKLHDSSCFSE